VGDGAGRLRHEPDRFGEVCGVDDGEARDGQRRRVVRPSMTLIPCASGLRTWTGAPAIPIRTPRRRKASSCAWAASRTAGSVRV